jgi:hypothetical protein
VFAACGGDDDGGSGGGGGGGTGNDRDYVAAICKAQLGFFQDLEKAIDEATGDETEEQVVEILAPALDRWVANIRNARPPADIRDYHNEVVRVAADAVNRIKETKSVDALDTLDSIPEAPAAVRDRLNAVAQENADCREVDFSFSD